MVAALFQDSEALAVLPLSIDRFHGLTRARLIGSDVSNSDWLAMSRRGMQTLAPEDITGLFAQLRCKTGHIDFLQFGNQPANWQGVANPLLGFRHQQSPDHLYRSNIATDPAARINAKRRRNLLRGKRRLGENFGAVKLLRARSREDIHRVHATFLAQRNVRFDRMGIDNPFARNDFVAFFGQAAESAIGEPNPALCFHALLAGDDIVATSLGAYCGTHYSQYINSTAEGPAARYSLMGILMLELTEELRASGIRTIDLGVGDFEYKEDWADKETVYDSFFPLTWRGRVAVPALAAWRAAKRRIKQDEMLWSLAKRLRLLMHRARTPATMPDSSNADVVAAHDAPDEIKREQTAWSA